MAFNRGNAVLYKGKPHMYIKLSGYIKDKHLIARDDKGTVTLTSVKTKDIKLTDPMDFRFGLSKEMEEKVRKF